MENGHQSTNPSPLNPLCSLKWGTHTLQCSCVRIRVDLTQGEDDEWDCYVTVPATCTEQGHTALSRLHILCSHGGAQQLHFPSLMWDICCGLWEILYTAFEWELTVCVHSVWMHKWFHTCVYRMMVTRNPGNEGAAHCSAPLPPIAGMWISWTASPAPVRTHQYTIIVRPNYNSGVQYAVCIYPHLLTYTAIFSVNPLLSCDQADSREEWKKCECSFADQVTVARPLPL